MSHWKDVMVYVPIVLIVLPLLTNYADAQKLRDARRQHLIERQTPDTSSRRGTENPRTAFKRIEQALAQGNADLLANFFGPKVFVSVSKDRSGCYSANQAYYILQGYFSLYQPVSVRFNSYGDIPTNPYAAGIYSYSSSLGAGSAQIYVSLNLVVNRWKIDQITITNR